MTIQPVGKKIQVEVEQPTAGGLDLSSKSTVVECGNVVAVGMEPGNLFVGAKIFFKAWALDTITYNKQTYYFIDSDSVGICAVVQE